jgi:hypothetical protein
MDADLLRIILAVLGALVIAGLYYWEQRRRHRDQDAEADDRDDPGRQGPDDEDWEVRRTDIDKIDTKREPRLGVWGRDEGTWMPRREPAPKARPGLGPGSGARRPTSIFSNPIRTLPGSLSRRVPCCWCCM